MNSNQQFVPTDANESKTTSPWTEWSTEFADSKSSVNLSIQVTPSADRLAANTQPDDAGDDALMDTYNG